MNILRQISPAYVVQYMLSFTSSVMFFLPNVLVIILGGVPGKSLVLDCLLGWKVFLNKKSENAPFTFLFVNWAKTNGKVHQHFFCVTSSNYFVIF